MASNFYRLTLTSESGPVDVPTIIPIYLDDVDGNRNYALLDVEEQKIRLLSESGELIAPSGPAAEIKGWKTANGWDHWKDMSDDPIQKYHKSVVKRPRKTK